ncbi:MAG: GNAT family N-acetyltransferase [Candidatus Omnitrophica bacterium]|nr:GNAT family N-acetyltransferase [Candidatus Omnitrophota bacterium]
MDGGLKDLIRLEEKHIEAAAGVFSRAFHNEPLKVLLFPDGKKRDEAGFHFFKFMLRYVILYGEAYAASENMEGAAMWLPSEYAIMTPELMAKAGVEELNVVMGKEFLAKVKPVYDFVEYRHTQNAPFPHWYLAFIGVDPDFQGKGFAGKLIKPMLSRIEAENLPCYLETQIEKNVSIYQHYGFKLIEKFFVPNTEMYFYTMLKGN